MININLLPEVLRKKERMPLPQMAGIVGMIIAIGAVFYMVTLYYFDTIPTLEQRRSSLDRQKRELTAQADELKQIRAEISKLNEYVDTVKGLYRNRTVWSKILADIKHIVNFDSTMSESNSEMRYIWLRTLSGRGKTITMAGNATASSQVVAMQLPERLISTFLTYSPINLPEKDEEERLLRELQDATAKHETARMENPSLPLQSPEAVLLRQRLDEIKNIRSGGVAMQPFSSLLVPGSLSLNNVSWGGAPQPRGTSDRLAMEEFPKNSWIFDITMQLK